MSSSGPRLDDGRWNTTPLRCDWCGVLMGYDETRTSEIKYSGDPTILGTIFDDDEANSWMLAPESTVVIVDDELNKYHGDNSLKYTGTGQATDIFDTYRPFEEAVDLTYADVIEFYFCGSNNGTNYAFWVTDGENGDITYFNDNTSGWTKVSIPTATMVLSGIMDWSNVEAIGFYSLDILDGSIRFDYMRFGTYLTVHLCYKDRLYVSEDNLAVEGQYATDKSTRDEAFKDYIDVALNPETSEEVGYPWY